MAGRVRGPHQRGADPGAAFAGSAAETVARAFMVAWTHPCPGGALPRIGEPASVGSHLGQEPFGKAALDAWKRCESLELRLLGTHTHGELATQALNGCLHGVHVGE